MHRILVVEDDVDLCELMGIHLQEWGYRYTFTHSGNAALKYLDKNGVDLILLDILLPGLDGIATCQQIRKQHFCPILFMSAYDDEEHILNALAMGGDDYIVKPIHYNQLRARIAVNLRRVGSYTLAQSDTAPDTLRKGDIVLRTDTRTVQRAGETLYLSPTEYSILYHMMRNPDRVLAAEELYRHVWAQDSGGDVRTVIVHISNLRRKLDTFPGEQRYITAVRGQGYLFEVD